MGGVFVNTSLLCKFAASKELEGMGGGELQNDRYNL